VHAARVVADHASERAAVVGSGIGCEGEVVLLGFGAEAVQNDSRFYAGDAPRRIDVDDASHVLRKVEDDGGVATLSGKRRASAASKQRSAVVAAKGNGGEDIFFVAGNYNADRNLSVVGAVGCIKRAAARVEANLSAKVAAEGGFKRGGVKLRGMGRRWGDVLRHSLQNIFEDTGAGRKGSHFT
jgi:hypothetical protein